MHCVSANCRHCLDHGKLLPGRRGGPGQVLEPPVHPQRAGLQNQPEILSLVFGKEADTHIWLVLDGNTLHVDRNGNGDLTEPGEKQLNTNPTRFTIDRLAERNGTFTRPCR